MALTSTRRFAAAALALIVLLCTSLFTFAQEKGPVKIGFLAPLVGVWAQNGKDMENGFRLALEESGMKAGGRQLVMLTEDDEGKPEVALTKAHKLIENDKIAVLSGVIPSPNALAVRDLAVNSKIPFVVSNAAAVDLTGKLKSPYIFRTSVANGQTDVVGAWYAYNKMGMKRMAVVATDFVAGHEKADAFIKAYKAAGGQIVEEIYPAINANDFSPYLSKIQAKAKSVDGVWVFLVGSGAIRFLQQYDEYGLKKTVPLFVLGDTIDDSYLPALKDVGLGIKNYLHYGWTLQTPENQKFVQAYRAKYKDYPSLFAEHGYVSGRVIVLALEATKGNIENKDAFLAALRKVKFNAPFGPFSFDANQNAIVSVYLRDVQKVNGTYENVVVGKIADGVALDWTPAKLMKAKK